MTLEMTGITKIAHNLLWLNQQLATGELVITHGKQSGLQWNVYFYLGRIIYATGGIHPVRRWYRAFKHYCAECFSTDWLIQAQSEDELWEIDLLNQAIEEGRINPAQYKAVVQSVVQEVMFTVVGQKFFTTQWHPNRQIAQNTTFLSVEQLIQDAQHLREQWRACGLGFLQELMAQFSPDLAPILRSRPQSLESQSPSKAYKSMLKLMRGQHTLWDIAIETQKPLPVVLRSLLPWIRHGMIELKEIPDLPALCSKPLATTLISSQATPQSIVACIDENISTCQPIVRILQPLGYQVITIHNPLRELATLLERKPQLIFFNPIISNTDGYEFCLLLRKTADFQHTPIIMVMGGDGVGDRVRSKLAGATELLTHPFDVAKVQHIAQKYLKPTPTPSHPTSPSQPDWVIA